MPILRSEPAYVRFLGHLFSGGWTCPQTGRIVIPAPLIRDCEGKSRSGYSAIAFLRRFKREVLPEFKWEDYKAGVRCRRVLRNGFPDWLNDLVQNELFTWRNRNEGHVVFASGAHDTSAVARAERQRARIHTNRLVRGGYVRPHQITALTYLNALDVRTITARLKPNWNDAWETAEQIRNPDTRNQQAKILRRIAHNPKPLYCPVQKSDRLYTVRPSLQNLKRPIRKILLRGCYDFDLAKAQLAIAATIWEIPEVKQFLTVDSPWQDLVDRVREAATDEATDSELKDAVKTATYAICYNAGDTKLSETLRDSGCFKNPIAATTRFRSHEAIRALMEKRKEVLDQIKREHGLENAFGEWVPSRNGRSHISIPAEVAQSYEQAIIYPAFELAANDRRFKIVLLQHDGFTVWFRDNRECGIRKPMREIIDVVNAKADELGIPTRLECEKLE